MGDRVGQIVKAPEVKQSNSNSQVRRTGHLQSKDTPVDRILFLQRTAGNQAVSRLIKSKALQAKLRIGQPGDKYEQEADRVADAVMRMPEPEMQRQVEPEEEEEEEEILQSKPLVDQITPLVQRQVEEEEEEELLQTMNRENATSEVTNDFESQINAIKGGGRPLAESERAFFEPRFGYDFGQVRMHTDTRAAETAQAVNARAFTIGQDIVFGAGQYASRTDSGQKLLAHELTHVVQQGRKEGPFGMVSTLYPDNFRPELIQNRIKVADVIAREEEAEQNTPVAITDETVYKVSDRQALLRTTPPDLASMRKKIPWDSQVKITQRFTKDGKSFVFVKKAYGNGADWGWTVESNLSITDVPPDARYGTNEATGYFIKNDKYLQQAAIDALSNIDNPIQIKNTQGAVVDEYYLRLTECIYPSSFIHKSKGHYTGHCVDIAFADSSGTKKTYGGAGKSKIEELGKDAFNAIYKHGNHFHGCVSYPSWVTARSTSQLKKLIKERQNEY